MRHRLALGQWQPGRESFLWAGEVGAGTSCVSAQLVISPDWVGAPRAVGPGLDGYRFPGGFREREGEDREARTLLRAFELAVTPRNAASARVPRRRALSAHPALGALDPEETEVPPRPGPGAVALR